MPSFVSTDLVEEEPPTLECAQLYTVMRREEAAQASSSGQQLLVPQADRYPFPYANPGFTTLVPELDPGVQGFPSSTAPPSFHYNEYNYHHFSGDNS